MPTYTAGKPQSTEFHVPSGEYRFRVIEAKDDTSKAGNEMIKLKLRVLHKSGEEGPALFDYLVFDASSLWKIDSFLKAVDQHPGEGKEVEVKAESLIGLEGEARLKVEDYNGKKSNKVDAYLFDEF